MSDDDVLAWLADSDPSLRWKVERDLLDAPEEQWQATRARVPREGFGAQLLAAQGEDGLWAGGAHFPADYRGEEDGQPWTATSWSLMSLREWGVDADALRPDTAGLLKRNARWEYDDLPFWDGEVDACINAFTLASGAWLGADVSGIRNWFVEHRLPDGGYNCEWVEGSTKSSFHSTINAVIGILDDEWRTGGTPELHAARKGAEEYLLERRLLYRLSTGERHVWAHHLGYPFRARFSALRALDHFRAAALHDGENPDPRLAEAVERVRDSRDADGTWHQAYPPEGREWFAVDVPAGEPSRWLTFFALRVLRWWDAAAA
ncbi:squalene cyclase [Microbacterium sp. lyk4-40-TSB-66]|uniref:squalene cyclase n=1 Tax=Microbacterium sp. lyk4-40-TSB-66 TaxID=3040294 RepID=UPI00254FD71F|nr:squalene cyclase [Microbacterium sp. lyk4-40-TSB-66]